MSDDFFDNESPVVLINDEPVDLLRLRDLEQGVVFQFHTQEHRGDAFWLVTEKGAVALTGSDAEEPGISFDIDLEAFVRRPLYRMVTINLDPLV